MSFCALLDVGLVGPANNAVKVVELNDQLQVAHHEHLGKPVLVEGTDRRSEHAPCNTLREVIRDRQGMGPSAGMACHGELFKAEVVGQLLHVRSPVRHCPARLRRRSAHAGLVGHCHVDTERRGEPLVGIANQARVAETMTEDHRRSTGITKCLIGELSAVGQCHGLHGMGSRRIGVSRSL